jgi:alpha-L-rhamnosidase
MCYPSDHEDGIYIPQWAMWYVLELEEFLGRTPSVDKEDYRKLCYDLLAYFKQYENADGLLEKLPSWNFVEWSRANGWTHDVNYPTNMLYVGTLRAIANIFDDEALREKSDAMEATVIRLGFNGEYFFDHAVRNEAGVLQNVETDVSETAQYYAIKFFRIAKDDARYATLIRAMLEDFRTGAEIRVGDMVMEPSNAFIGMYLRLEILHRWEEYRLMKRDILDMFGGMAEATGTLWENKDTSGSLNHGFTSFVAVLLNHTPREFLV